MQSRSAIALTIILCCAAFCSLAQSPATDEENLRDPFWPVDYDGPKPHVEVVEDTTKQSADVVQPDQSQTESTSSENRGSEEVKQPPPVVSKSPEWPKLKVKGVIKGPDGKYVANIEGIGVVEEGRKCKAVSQGVMFIYKIEEITERGVKIVPIEARPLKQQ